MHGKTNGFRARAWHMALFEGLAPDKHSHKLVCQQADVWCVCIADNFITTQVVWEQKLVLVSMHLEPSLKIANILAAIWHVSGLAPEDLISVSACPPCDTFTKFNNLMQYPHRWPNGEPADLLAVEHDDLLKWLIHVMFGVSSQ